MSTEVTALTDTALADPRFEQQHPWDTGMCPSSVSPKINMLSILHGDAMGRGEFPQELIASVLPLLEH